MRLLAREQALKAIVLGCLLVAQGSNAQEASGATAITPMPYDWTDAWEDLSFCKATQGDWCEKYRTQDPLPVKPVPRGDKSCPNDCHNVGNCDYDTGTCWCPAGYGGPDCSTPRKRPCWRMGKDRRDESWTNYEEWSHSRCAGICDDDIAMCYCPPETRHGHIMAPATAPLGSPPIKIGRPLYWCHPSTDANNNTIKWGAIKYPDLFGPDGWCNADISNFRCPCRIDGVVGDFCNIKVEMYCSNQCNGHGACNMGFCKCYDGWYGNDCSRKRKGLPLEPGDENKDKTWLKSTLTTVAAALDPPLKPTRKRPFVYVYDTAPEYNTDILQYRIERAHCSYRGYVHGNRTDWHSYTYALESVLIELFQTSGHRTFDPEEADFFFVPTMAGCLYDVYGWNPIPMWPPKHHGPRPYGSGNMLLQAQRWLAEKYPYFNRNKGQDHIWVMPHDEGACAAPKEIWPGIILSHWGRMDFPHTSNTQYHADNYTTVMIHPDFPGGWAAHSSGTHPCFDPDKDLIIPCFKPPPHYKQTAYMGGWMKPRETLLFFRGDTGKRRVEDKNCVYSRCIRQTIAKHYKEENWKQKYNIIYGEIEEAPGEYWQLLSSSKFCLALPGDGWSARFEDSVLHGCIPVIIMDNTQVPFESILNMSLFTVRILQKDIPKIPEILLAITAEKIADMKRHLDKVWQRYRYAGLTMIDTDIEDAVERLKMEHGGKLPTDQDGMQYAKSRVDDAFSTILQWLLSRIPHTRGAPRPNEKLYIPPLPHI